MSTSIFLLLSVKKFMKEIISEIKNKNEVIIIMPNHIDLLREEEDELRAKGIKLRTEIPIKNTDILESELKATKNIEYIFAFEEYCILPAANLRERLNVRGKRPADVIVFRDKLKMVEKLSSMCPKKVKIPYTEEFRDESQIISLLAKYDKLVAKRTDGMGSKDMQVFVKDLTPCEISSRVGKMRTDKKYIIQEFIEGKVYHYDTYIIENKPIINNLMEYIEFQYKYKTNHSLTALSVQKGKDKDCLLAAANEVLKLYGLNNVTIHLELIYDGKDVYFCEVGIRPGGAAVVPTIIELYGVDLFEIDYLLQSSNMKDIPVSVPEPKKLAGWTIIYPKYGTVSKIEGIDKIRNLSEVRMLKCLIKVGDSLRDQQHCASSVLQVVYVSDCRDRLQAITHQIYNNFLYEVR